MVHSTNTTVLELEESFSCLDNVERIRPSRDGRMPVSRSTSAVRGRRRNKSAKRKHRAPQHCQGASRRRIKKWK